MERKTVDPKKSSQVRSFGYDKEKQTLQIEFSSGGVYDYFAVPESVYEDFIRSESLGGFVATRIRGMFEYKRLHSSECLVGTVDRDCGASGCSCWCHRLTKTSREEKPSEEKKASKKGSSKKKVC